MAEARPRFWRRPASDAAGLSAGFQLLFEAAPQPMALVGAAGALLASNAALRHLAGPLLVLRPGQAAASLLAPVHRPALDSALAALAAGAGEQRLEAVPAGAELPPDGLWQLLLRPLALPGGGLAVLLQAEDLTERRRAQARLASASRLETVGGLAGGIAHDFNNLLTAVLGSLDAARTAGASEVVRAELAPAEDAARRGAGLVRQLLAFAGRQALQPRVLALNDALRGIAPLLRRLLGEAVRLELALQEPGRLILVDPGQLDQVILNLAVNARDAMPQGGTLRLATDHAVALRPEGESRGEGPALPPGRYTVLEVSDTGRGIPPEALKRIFEPFFTTRIDKGGTGLGLATVHGIVTQSGGRILVESEVGQGTRFRVHFPRHDGPLPPSTEVVSPPPAVPEPAAPLLLVEDEASLRRLAERVLARAGYPLLAAESAEAAMVALEDAGRPAALVSDVAMPGMDGLALARQLRQRWPGLPVLLLSGYAQAMLDEPLESQGIGFLAKPYTPVELLAAVAALLPVATPPS